MRLKILDKSITASMNARMDFNRCMDRFSPIRMGIVSMPTIRSPCMSRMSKKAVLTNTMPVAHRNTKIVPVSIRADIDKGGKRDVTMPQAMAIKIVFEPGMSRILR